MKGLITKDLFMIAKHFKLYFLLDVIFIIAAFFSPETVSFMMVPVLISGIIPISLLAYDERSRWTEYSGVLPYSRTQIVSAKYLMGLLMQSVMCAVLYIMLLITGAYYGNFDPAGSAVTVMMLFVFTTFFPAVCLPFCFAFGTERGRISCMAVSGALIAASVALGSTDVSDDITTQDIAMTIPPFIWVVIIALYALSWLLSIAIYNKKEAGKV